MKKLVLFVCSALIIGFNSCSSDDPLTDNGGGNSNSSHKRITKIDSNQQKGAKLTSFHYTYDSKGQWIEYLWKKDNGSRINNSSLTYSGNTIIQKDYDDENSLTTITYTLNNQNLIISQIGDPHSVNSNWEYKYDNGFLKNIYYLSEGKVYISIELGYTDGNLTSWKESKGRHYSFIYSDIENKTGLNISPIIEDFNSEHPKIRLDIMPLIQQGYFGKLSKNLVKEIREENTIYSYIQMAYDYTLNNDGLVDRFYLKNGSDYVLGEYKFYY